VSKKHLPIAVRAFTERAKPAKPKGSRSRGSVRRWPRYCLLFDTETTIDTTQRLTFGSYRICEWGQRGGPLVCRSEGIFYADDLPKTDPKGFECLREYARSQSANVGPGVTRRLKLLSRTEFVKTVFWRFAYKSRALVVGFNLPFDLSRLAVGCGTARGSKRGAFSLTLWEFQDPETGHWRPNTNRPRVVVQHVDSKMAFIHLTGTRTIDPKDRRPVEGAPPDSRYSYRGRFLDLKTLAFALTDQAYTLESACKAFGVAHPKTKASEHGVITPDYIDYNRRDVLASQELLERLREEFDRHPIALDPWQAYSPASIAKAYFDAMGLRPPREQFRKIPPELIGYAMSGFYGGRAEARIRKAIVPVVHTDFTSMYPTVQSLMGLWRLTRAERIEVVEDAEAARTLLAEVSVDACFRPETWRELVGFAQVVPEGDTLPARAQHRGSEWTVGVNRLTSTEPLWYALPDLVASTLLTGKPPRVLQAFRLVPRGRQRKLRTVQLGGGVEIDPSSESLFRAVIEARQQVKRDQRLEPQERDRIERFLKTFANAGNYGVFVEMIRKTLRADRPAELAVYGRAGGFFCKTAAPEDAGRFCFPPIGALITASARLMLALLERSVTDAGGSYAFADTDSMAIVANASGGLVPCEGGARRSPDGRPAIRALSWEEVDSIVDRFEALNPYDRSAVPGSILKIEDVNRDPETGERRPIHAFAISAKRYALFTIGADGRPEILDGKEHGLGQYLNPIDPEREDRDWIREMWEGLVGEALGGPPFQPSWGDVPAMMRSPISTPLLLNRFFDLNRKKSFANCLKPFNFLLSATVDSFDRPAGVSEFHLIAPYSRNPLDWLRFSYSDVHSGKKYRIRTNGSTNGSTIRVQTFANVLDRFRIHPEAKSAGPDGNPSDSWTSGLLGRLNVRVLAVFHIGKESNFLEQQERGVLLTDPQAVYAGGDDWEAVRPWLDRVSISELAARSGVSSRMLRNLRRGDRRPSAKALEAIIEALVQMLDEAGGRGRK
jgi:hypothetical protein